MRRRTFIRAAAAATVVPLIPVVLPKVAPVPGYTKAECMAKFDNEDQFGGFLVPPDVAAHMEEQRKRDWQMTKITRYKSIHTGRTLVERTEVYYESEPTEQRDVLYTEVGVLAITASKADHIIDSCCRCGDQAGD